MTSGAWNKYSFSLAAKGKKKKKKKTEKKKKKKKKTGYKCYHDLSEMRRSKYL